MRNQTRRSKACIGAIAAALLLCGCQSLEQLAPPVTALAVRPSASLDLGREIYITRCTKCHAPDPVLKHSKHEWEKIIVEMAEETKLTPAETSAVRSYVMAVLSNAPTYAAGSATNP